MALKGLPGLERRPDPLGGGGAPPSAWRCPGRPCVVPRKAPKWAAVRGLPGCISGNRRSLLFFGKVHIPEPNIRRPDLWAMGSVQG